MEGLLCHGGRLLESTGLEGSSRVTAAPFLDGQPGAAMAATTGADPALVGGFGEGLAVHGDGVWWGTWRQGVVHRLHAASLQLTATTPIPRHRAWAPDAGGAMAAFRDLLSGTGAGQAGSGGEGADRLDATLPHEVWGMTTDWSRGAVVVSDGSPALHLYAPDFSALLTTVPLSAPPSPWWAAIEPPASCPALSQWPAPAPVPGPVLGGQSGALNWRLNELEYVPGRVLDDAWSAACAAIAATRQPTWACPPRLPASLRGPAVEQPCDGGAEVWAAVQGCGHVVRIHACSGVVVGWGLLRWAHGATADGRGAEAPAVLAEVGTRVDGRERSVGRRSWGGEVLSAAAAATGGDEATVAAGLQRGGDAGVREGDEVDAAQQHATRGDMNGIAVCTVDGLGVGEAGGGDVVVVIGGKKWERLFVAPLREVVREWMQAHR